MRISKNDFDTMLKQIYLDCNVSEAIKVKDDLYIAPSVVLPGSRVINKMDPFFRVVVFMGTAYVMANEDTIDGFIEILKDYPAEWFFNYGRLRKIDCILNEFNREIVDTHIYFLPDEDDYNIEIPSDWKWFSEDEIAAFKDKNPFNNALCYSPTQPDVYGLGAPDGKGFYKGMSGASLDGLYTRQIGIDVLPAYRGEGLATRLVRGLKQKIREDGYLPFYGTAESHALSRSVGVKSGFLPAFSEIFVSRKDNNLKSIYNR